MIKAHFGYKKCMSFFPPIAPELHCLASEKSSDLLRANTFSSFSPRVRREV